MSTNLQYVATFDSDCTPADLPLTSEAAGQLCPEIVDSSAGQCEDDDASTFAAEGLPEVRPFDWTDHRNARVITGILYTAEQKGPPSTTRLQGAYLTLSCYEPIDNVFLSAEDRAANAIIAADSAQFAIYQRPLRLPARDLPEPPDTAELERDHGMLGAHLLDTSELSPHASETTDATEPPIPTRLGARQVLRTEEAAAGRRGFLGKVAKSARWLGRGCFSGK